MPDEKPTGLQYGKQPRKCYRCGTVHEGAYCDAATREKADKVNVYDSVDEMFDDIEEVIPPNTARIDNQG